MDKFEWDNNKQKINLDLHGVDFMIASLIFDDDNCFHKVDDRCDYGEIRYQTIGKVFDRELFVVWTYRGKRIRIISARYANKKEKRFYDENISKAN